MHQSAEIPAGNLDAEATARPLTYSLAWYGCQMSEHDAEQMDALMAARGWRRTDDEFGADIVVINTCTVRQGAEDRALARLQRLNGTKRRHPGKVIALCGCVAQKEGVELLDRFPFLDLVVGTRDFHELPRLIDLVRRRREPIVATDSCSLPIAVEAPSIRQNPVRAFVNIMFGCNNHCTFCIVPRVRGREVYRPLESILNEARDLAAQGYKEIYLLGQNVNSWKDAAARCDFSDLLAALDQITGLLRIRYTTSNPKDLRPRLIETVAGSRAVCENFHLPVQSGSSRVLRLMKRAYNRRQFLRLVARVREAIPDAVITTDIIVGFPGETDEDFRETLSLVEEVEFDSAFMFAYSPRPGTFAARSLPDDVPPEVKHDRLQRLIALQEGISARKNQALVGQTVEVLVDGPSRRYPHQVVGRTRGDKMVAFPGGTELVGRIVPVRIVRATSHSLVGEPAIACAL
ncbi:MAG: tRNA (N6-isopentenyl adenosine(37)-C2)-methylthiotransferase MiaB [Candidatus Sumerlaeia bacterium]